MLVAIGRVVRRSRPRKISDIQLHADFSIAELDELRRSGQLSPEEFERAKGVVLARSPEQTSNSKRGFAVIQQTDQR